MPQAASFRHPAPHFELPPRRAPSTISIQMIDEFRARQYGPVLAVAVDDLRAFARHAKRHFTQLAQRMTNRRLLFRRRIDEQKPAATRTKKFSAKRACLARELIIQID